MKHSSELHDPLSHLSTSSIREKAGYYINGGYSPYTVESLRPGKDYLADKQPREPLLDYIKRRSADSPDALIQFMTDGMPVIQGFDTNSVVPQRQHLTQIGRRVLNVLFNSIKEGRADQLKQGNR